MSGKAWAWDFWHLQRGDTAVECVLKVKERHWWLWDEGARDEMLEALLTAVLNGQPQTSRAKADRLERAIEKAEGDMRGQPLPGDADVRRRMAIAARCLRRLRFEALAAGLADAAVEESTQALEQLVKTAGGSIDRLQLVSEAAQRRLDDKFERAHKAAALGVSLAAPKRLVMGGLLRLVA